MIQRILCIITVNKTITYHVYRFHYYMLVYLICQIKFSASNNDSVTHWRLIIYVV